MKTTINTPFRLHDFSVLSLVIFGTMLAFAAVTASAQNTHIWTGATDGNWATATNWTGTDTPPGTATTDIARFNADVINKAVSIGTDTTLDSLEFVAGAGSYTFSGAILTLNRISTGGATISNSSGNLQTFSTRVNFAGSAMLNVSAGSSLTFASTIGKTVATGGNLTVTGGGVVNFTGSFSNFTLFTNLIASGGATINYDTASQNGANNYQANGGRINLHRATGGSGIKLQLLGNGSEIYLSKAALTVGAALTFRGDGVTGKTLTFGADFAGTGTATHSGSVLLNENGATANQTYRLYAAAGNTLALSGIISDSNVSATGTKVLIDGAGIVRFSGSGPNTSVTPIAIDGTLVLAKTAGTDAIGGGSVTVNTTGTLRLAASNQIADATALAFAGGVFEAGAFTETLGALTVGAAGGTIDFDGKAGSLTFASLSSITGTLTVTGWSDDASIFFTNGSGWDTTALSRVVFSGYGAAQFDSATGELYAAAIPEPSAIAALAASLAFALGLVLRRRTR
ncbi:beta strand repeat-containing protein [Geminisphaera colitermitum]|uniref:beta strand repeat-containing protein n=1 Tax=Geminisphaera colitermitum TaxID=1148786 RepID=UPI000158D4FB|nr:PEP-CTERM sorting domain-containing protein [Geminisphaera colitermitum]